MTRNRRYVRDADINSLIKKKKRIEKSIDILINELEEVKEHIELSKEGESFDEDEAYNAVTKFNDVLTDCNYFKDELKDYDNAIEDYLD